MIRRLRMFSDLSFKSRLLALILVFAMLPILVVVAVLYYTQAQAALAKNNFYQASNNIMFSEIFDSYYYRTVVSDLEVLNGRREKLKLMSKAIIKAYSLNDEESGLIGSSSIIRNIMFESTRSSGMMPFIFDIKKPESSHFVRADYRRLLKYTTILGISLQEFLMEGKFHNPGTFHVLTDKKNSEVYLLNITAMDDRHILVIGERQNDLKTEFMNVKKQIIEALNNVMRPEGRELSSDRRLFTFILDSDGKQVAPLVRDGYEPMFLEKKQREEVKAGFNQNSSATYQMSLNNVDYQMVISYYNQMGMYIVSATPITDILHAQREETSKFIIIGCIVAFFAILIAMVLVSDLVKPLSAVTLNTRKIATLDLRDIVSVRRFINRFDRKRTDEVGEISKAISKMTTNLSSNICNLLETQDRQRKIEGELNTAKDIQLGILPDNLDSPIFSPLKINGKMIPAKEVGGDLYDVIELDEDNVAFIIGDVSDKGVPAALFMVMTVTIIRQCFSLKMSSAEVMNEVNKVLCKHNPNMMFVTLFLGVLNRKTGAFTYANGGHCQPVLCHNNSVSVLEGLSGPAPGVADGFEYKEFSCLIDKNTRIFLYTDGVSEAQNEEKQLFGENRINLAVSKFASLDVKEFSESMLNEILSYRGTAPQSDDITMLVADYPQ
ncbi:SpoIIE family protein phosphatase [Succinivibrio dextrinosolvens]|uniref:SpoIIE family protein phosphatase n=1 Tax=Succinivibrio dextrinosolvens TaxID=83771 RepID=UPI0009425E5C|nr:SpoIIE family protein phosphatase [Succinivibrio dextrinosolvens]